RGRGATHPSGGQRASGTSRIARRVSPNPCPSAGWKTVRLRDVPQTIRGKPQAPTALVSRLHRRRETTEGSRGDAHDDPEEHQQNSPDAIQSSWRILHGAGAG